MPWASDINEHKCLFVLDSNAILDLDSKTIKTPKNNLIYTEGSASIVNRVGSSLRDFKNNLKAIQSYNCFRLDSCAPTLELPIPLYSDYTMILKCFINGSTKLGGSSFSGSQPYGLSFNPVGFSSIYLNNWRLPNLETGQEYAEGARVVSTDTIHNVVARISYDNKTVSIETDYGVYTNSLSSEYRSGYDYVSLGFSPQPETTPKIDIIGYAIYSGLISKTDSEYLFKSLDDKFLTDSLEIVPEKLFSVGTSFSHVPKYSSENRVLDLKDNLLYNNPGNTVDTLNQSSTDFNDVVCAQNLYKGYTDIMDIVLEEGLPVKTLLYLHERITGKLLKTTFSNLQGEFKFYNLSDKIHHVITSHDNKYQFKSILKNYDN